jgi:aspartate carbamoyltransferase catalytic subunit
MPIYMTRIQDEWDQAGESKAIDISRFQLRAEHLQVLRPEAIIMHPLPRRHEIAPEIDADPRAKVLAAGAQRHVGARGADPDGV